MRPAWAAAEALARCTCRVEAEGPDGWRARGTAFFVTNQLLLTCAHVVGAGNYRVVWYGPSKLNEIPVEVVARYPDLQADAAASRIRRQMSRCCASQIPTGAW